MQLQSLITPDALITPTDIIVTNSNQVANLILSNPTHPQHLIYSSDMTIPESITPTKILLKNERQDIIKSLKSKYPTANVYYPPNTSNIGEAQRELESLSPRTKPPKIHHYI